MDGCRGFRLSEKIAHSVAAGPEEEEPLLAIPDTVEEATFEEWLNISASDEIVAKAASNYWRHREVKEDWNAKHGKSKVEKPPAPASKIHRPSKCTYRTEIAIAYNAWRAGDGKETKQPHVDFMRTIRCYKIRHGLAVVPKADTVWLSRLLQRHNKPLEARVATTGRRNTRIYAKTVPDAYRVRDVGTQGAPLKCPMISEMLWDWFLDIRRSFKSTVSPRFMLNKARNIAQDCLKDMQKAKAFVAMPIINSNWLYRWKHRFKVVWRKPNAKFKLSWTTLQMRCSATWLNVQSVQQLAKRVLGRELPVEGIDEKPIHFNEAGSKSVSTLEIAGEDEVALKHNHAASRERVTVMTFTTSDVAQAASPGRLPIEIMRKGTTARCLQGVRAQLPDDLSVSATYSPKGSYRHGDMLAYVKQHCEEWTPEREAAKDYRIMLLDVARSHIGRGLVDLLWSRGYITLYHYGGITGVLQVNDTDNHAQFEREYLECEGSSMHRRQQDDPSDIGRDFWEVVADVCTTWRLINHAQCARGYKTTGITVALPADGETHGPEDHLIRRAAADVWKGVNMVKLRRARLDQVNKALDDKKAKDEILTMSLWRALVQDPADPGIMPEGYEFEGELLEGERPWISAEQDALEDEKEKALDCSIDPSAVSVDFSEQIVLDPSSYIITAMKDEEPEAVAEAILTAKEIAKCDGLRAWGLSMKMPFVVREALRRKIAILKKQRPSVSKPKLKAQLILQRHLRQQAEADHDQMEKRRAVIRERKALVAKNKAEGIDKKVIGILLKEKKAADAKKLAELGDEFTAEMCGQKKEGGGKTKEQNNRQNMMERLKLRSPALPPNVEKKWTAIRNNYCKQVAYHQGGYTGAYIVKQVNDTIDALGKHWIPAGIKPKVAKKEGNPKAFELLVKEMIKDKWGATGSGTKTPAM